MAGVPPQFKKSVIARRLKQNKGHVSKPAGQTMSQAATPGKSAGSMTKGGPPGRTSPGTQGKNTGVKPGAIQRRLSAKPDASAPPGQGGRFAAMLAQGVPPGAAANAGRKKYGKKAFQQMAARGRS